MTGPIGPLRDVLPAGAMRGLEQAMRQAATRNVDGLTGGTPTAGGAGPAPLGGGGPSFADTFARALDEVNATRNHGGDMVRRFAAGEPVEIHQVMAASEEAGVALDLVIELRNKVVEAYRSLTTMQT